MSRSEYEKIKSLGRLPSPSGVALELMRLVDDETTTVDQITRTIEADPAITANLLKLVNSPLAGSIRTVASTSLAVRMLGMRTVKNLALGFSLLTADRCVVSKEFDYDQFWRESLARAVAARSLADHFRACASDEAFTVALLSRIGNLALATAYPSEYDAILQKCGKGESASLRRLECKSFGIDQNALTAEMFGDWRLAPVYCEAVRLQDSIASSPSCSDRRVTTIARLLHLTDVTAAVLSRSEVYHEDLVELMRAAQECEFDSTDFTSRFDHLKDEWPQLASIFSIDAPSVPSLRDTHTRATRQLHSVLVVDDDESVRVLLTKYLSDAGYVVRTAENGLEAYDLIHSEGFQLVITDLNMPKMGGLELSRAVRESDGAGFVYIIVLTAAGTSDHLAAAFEAGADDFLDKSLKKEELLPRLKAGIRAVASEAKIASQRRALHRANAELATYNHSLKQLATTDELTGLHNRREAMQRLKECWSASDRYGQPLACMMIDIDHFKVCNDTYGHDVGDAILRETSQVIKNCARRGETVFRVGGEEFLVLCPESNAQMASLGAERIRAAVEAHKVTCGEEDLRVSISIGVAARTDGTSGVDALLKEADQALYAAKRKGRNRVCMTGIGSSAPPVDNIEIQDLAPAAQASHVRDSGESPATVMIVDDDLSSRRLFRRLLERDGFHVVEATDGREALSKSKEVCPNVIVMDIDLPDIAGIECTRRLKADPVLGQCPVIVVSGRAYSNDVEGALEAGAEEYVSKPVRHNEFVLRVRSMCRLQQRNAELQRSNDVRGEQARAMTILFDFTRSLSVCHDQNDIASITVRAAAELLGCCRVALMLPDEFGRFLKIAGALGITEDSRMAKPLPFGHGIAGRVYESGKTVVCNTESELPTEFNPDDAESEAEAPFIVKALRHPEKIVGALCASGRRCGQPFSAHEVEYLDLICNMATSAFERLHAGQSRERAHAAIVIGLAKLAEHRDEDTGRHLDRVTRFALIISRELRGEPYYAGQIDDRFLSDLENAIPLHDIGKVAIPDAVLLKPGKLTQQEFEVMKRHAQVGADALDFVASKAPEAGFLKMGRDIARFHHERFDGTGYPDGLAGEQIPLAARVAAVADVYDALRSERPYKKAFPHAKAIEIIQAAAGAHLDPGIVDAFLRCEKEISEIAARLGDDQDTSHIAITTTDTRVVVTT